MIGVAGLAAVGWAATQPARVTRLLRAAEMDAQDLLVHVWPASVFLGVITGLAGFAVVRRQTGAGILALALFGPLFLVANVRAIDLAMAPRSASYQAERSCGPSVTASMAAAGR